MTAACIHVPVVKVTLDLPLELRERACLMAAEMALHNNCAVTIVGLTANDEMLLCPDGCCENRLGVIVAVADTEAISRWGSVPKGAMSVSRADGRVAYVFQSAAVR